MVIIYLILQLIIFGLAQVIGTYSDNSCSVAYRKRLKESNLSQYIMAAKDGDYVKDQDVQEIQMKFDSLVQEFSQAGATKRSLHLFAIAGIIWIVSVYLSIQFFDSSFNQYFGVDVGYTTRSMIVIPILALFVLSVGTLFIDSKWLRNHIHRNRIGIGIAIILNYVVEIIRNITINIDFIQDFIDMGILLFAMVFTVLVQFGFNSRIITERLLEIDKEIGKKYGKCAAAIKKLSMVRLIADKRFQEFATRKNIDLSNLEKTKIPLVKIIDQGLTLYQSDFSGVPQEYLDVIDEILHMDFEDLEYRFYDEFSSVISSPDLEGIAIRILLSLENEGYRKHKSPELGSTIKEKRASIRKALDSVVSTIVKQFIDDEYKLLFDFTRDVGTNYLNTRLSKTSIDISDVQDELVDFVDLAKDIVSFLEYSHNLNLNEIDEKLEMPSSAKLAHIFSSKIPKNLERKHLQDCYDLFDRPRKRIPFLVVLACYQSKITNSMDSSLKTTVEFAQSVKCETKWMEIIVKNLIDICECESVDDDFLIQQISRTFSKIPRLAIEDVRWSLSALEQSFVQCESVLNSPDSPKRRSRTKLDMINDISEAIRNRNENQVYLLLAASYANAILGKNLGDSYGMAIWSLYKRRFIVSVSEGIPLFNIQDSKNKVAILEYLCFSYFYSKRKFDQELYNRLHSYFQLCANIAFNWIKSGESNDPVLSAERSVEYLEDSIHYIHSLMDFPSTFDNFEIKEDSLLKVIGVPITSEDFYFSIICNLQKTDIKILNNILSRKTTQKCVSLVITISSEIPNINIANSSKEILGGYAGAKDLLDICNEFIKSGVKKNRIIVSLRELYVSIIKPSSDWEDDKKKPLFYVIDSLMKSYSESLFNHARILNYEQRIDIILNVLKYSAESIHDFIDWIEKYKLQASRKLNHFSYSSIVDNFFEKLDKGKSPRIINVVYSILKQVISDICEGGENDGYCIFLVAAIANSIGTLRPEEFGKYIRNMVLDTPEALDFAVVYSDNYSGTDNTMIVRYFRLVELVQKWRSTIVKPEYRLIAINIMHEALEQSGWVRTFRELRDREEIILENEIRTERKITLRDNLRNLIEQPDARSRRFARSIQGLFYQWKVKDKDLDRLISERPYNLFLLSWHKSSIDFIGIRPSLNESKLPLNQDYKTAGDIIGAWIVRNQSNLGSPFLIGNSARIGKIPEGLVFTEFKHKVYDEVNKECIIHLGKYPRILLIRFAPSKYSVQALSDAKSVELDVVESIMHTHKAIGEGERADEIRKFEIDSIIGQLTLIETLTTLETVVDKMEESSITIHEVLENNPQLLFKGMLIEPLDISFYGKSANKTKFNDILDEIRRKYKHLSLTQIVNQQNLNYYIRKQVEIKYRAQDRTKRVLEREISERLITWLFEVISDLDSFLTAI